jgi:signal peptidase II
LNLRTRLVVFLACVLAILLADQVSKRYIVLTLELNSGFEAIPGVLNIVHVRNPGAAWGFLANFNSGMRIPFFMVISASAVCITIWIVLFKKLTLVPLLGLAFFCGGALGNLVDRFNYGEVIDFLDFHIGVYHWPAFNVADTALCLGTAFFFLQLLFFSKNGTITA